jgi:hypothetical protein
MLLYADGRGLLENGKLKPGTGLCALLAGQPPGPPEQKSRGKPDGATTYWLWGEIEHRLKSVFRESGGDRFRCSQSILDVGRAGTKPNGKIPDANLRRALQLLSLDSYPDRIRPISAYAHLDVRGLGDAYEVLMDYGARAGASKADGGVRGRTSLRKTTGRYYTPEHIVKHVVKAALSRRVMGLASRQILGIRVLDPAMGSGHFLLGAADFLASAYGRARVREGKARHGLRLPAGELRRYKQLVIGKCLYGVDTDPVAVELARYSLWIEAGGGLEALRGLEAHLKPGDALFGASFTADNSDTSFCLGRHDARSRSGVRNDRVPFHWKTEFPDIARHGRRLIGFDAVIGNPPYVSFSGRQKPRTGGEHGADRRRANGRKGWPSVHGSFILRATELINDRGTICFIIPAQVGLLPGYAAVRSGLLDVCNLIEVRYWGEHVFRGVTTPALTFLAVRHGAYRAGRCNVVTEAGTSRRFSPRGADPWHTSTARYIFKRMAGLHGTLGTFSDPGVHTGNAAAGLLLPHPKGGSVPVVEGRRIRPFHCDPPGRWLDLTYKPSDDEYFRVSDQRTYRDTDIIIRQTATRPVAARHVHRCHFRNSVLALKAPTGFSVEYLLGILNSDVAAMLYQAYSPECLQRAFPQIKVNALKQLPIPDPRHGLNRRVAARIEKIAKALEARARDGRAMDGLIADLNRLVRKIYGLEDHEAQGTNR